MAQKKILTHTSEEATQETNQTGTMSPILKFAPNDDRVIAVHNGEEGVPLIGKLYDSNGDLIPADAELMYTLLASGRHIHMPASELQGTYQPWRTLDENQQRDDDRHKDNVRMRVADGGTVYFRDVDEFRLCLRSDTQVDWSQGSTVYLEEQIEEMSREEYRQRVN